MSNLTVSEPSLRAISSFIWTISPPVLIVFGTIGNLISIYVLNQRPRTSTSIYLTALAICDLFMLYCGLGRQWSMHVFQFDVRNVSAVICKLHFFSVTFSAQMTSWILVAITVERVISVRRPHLARPKCTKMLALLVLTTEVIVLLLLDGHLLYGVSIVRVASNVWNTTGVNINGSDGIAVVGFDIRCEPNEVDVKYAYFMFYVWTWIDFCVSFFVPFLVLLSGNFLIIDNVRKSARFQQECMRLVSSLRRQRPKPPILSLTAILLTLNTVFFVCVAPVNMFIIGQFYWWPAKNINSETAELIWAIVSILMYTNNSTNFILYVFCGSEFRTEVKLMCLKLCRMKPKVPHRPRTNTQLSNNSSEGSRTSNL